MRALTSSLKRLRGDTSSTFSRSSAGLIGCRHCHSSGGDDGLRSSHTTGTAHAPFPPPFSPFSPSFSASPLHYVTKRLAPDPATDASIRVSMGWIWWLVSPVQARLRLASSHRLAGSGVAGP
jgi:hypothetical protein